MRLLVLMDPLETVNMKKDTSFIIMCGAHDKGHEVYYLPNGGITKANGRLKFHATRVIPQRNSDQPFTVKEDSIFSEDDVDALFIRTDPPFSDQYLMNTWLLDSVKDKIVVINDPSGIRTVNEKIWATQFTSIVPPTLVGQYEDDFQEFLKEHEEIVVKPTDAHGGRSIFRIAVGDKNANVTFETLTDHWSKKVILQKYIPESVIGDKRVILLNGEPLGAVLRVHAEDDHRNNFFSGGKPQPTEIDKRDLAIIEVLIPKLREIGLFFVGIDIMGGYLVEVNVTSPTCLQEINGFAKKNLEKNVVEFLEKLVEEQKSSAKI